MAVCFSSTTVNGNPLPAPRWLHLMEVRMASPSTRRVLIRVGFLVTANIMDTCAFLETPRPRSSLVALGGFRHGQSFLRADLCVPTPDGRPGFWYKATLRQRLVTEQGRH